MEEKKECKHENWEVQGANEVGNGYCFDCKREVSLAVLFNNLRLKMEEAIKATKG